MPTHEEVRQRLKQAFARPSAEGPITLALEWELGRDYIQDFLKGRKDTMDYEVIENLSAHFGIPISLLVIRRNKKKRLRAAG